MKHQSAIVLSGTVAAIVAISLLGFNTLSATPFLVAENVKGPSAAASILGHVTYMVKDKDGNVKQYLQSDNVVTGMGHICATAYLFANKTNTAAGLPTCQSINTGNGAHAATFQYIGIGNGTGGTFTGAETSLPTTAGFEVTPRSISNPAVTLSNPSGQQAMATITNSGAPFTFTQLRASGTTLTASGLFDTQNCNASGGCAAAGVGDMFADQSINVAVANTDSLTVTWKITLN
jgi:hypothetical protein